MEVRFDILRMDPAEKNPYWQSILYQGLEEQDTIATALRKINEDPEVCDIHGNPVGKICWECSCLQKKCGACAMRIDGVPALACSVILGDKKAAVTLEPLRKFPVIADLYVDRSTLFDALLQLEAWLEKEAQISGEEQEILFESSRCLQCGCCLEVCPNFYVGGEFSGMAAMTPMTRILSEMPEEQMGERRKKYRKQIYEGCGKSLACRKICPAGIDIDKLLVRSNAIAVWKRKRRC